MVYEIWPDWVSLIIGIMDGNEFYRLYFILFYYFSVIVGVNLVETTALEIYESVENLDLQRQYTVKLLEKNYYKRGIQENI